MKDDKKYKTHGITFDGFKYFSGDGSDKIGIFESIEDYFLNNNEKLNPLYTEILQHLKIDKNEDGNLSKKGGDASELACLSV